MAFVVEDGSAKSEANALVSVDECTSYHQERGNSAWSGTQAEMEAAIVKASDHLCRAYPWRGRRVSAQQGLCWPRLASDGVNPLLDGEGFALATDSVPSPVRQACCELALEAMTGRELGPVRERGGLVRREKVDLVEVEYEPGAPAGPVYPRVRDRLLRAGLIQGAAARRLARA